MQQPNSLMQFRCSLANVKIQTDKRRIKATCKLAAGRYAKINPVS
jgi:hypothetical protein